MLPGAECIPPPLPIARVLKALVTLSIVTLKTSLSLFWRFVSPARFGSLAGAIRD